MKTVLVWTLICALPVVLLGGSGAEHLSGSGGWADRASVSAWALGSGSTLVVTSTADSGPGTLRDALRQARSGDTITFDPTVFPPNNSATIYVRSELPFILRDNLTIDASNAGVILDGDNCSGGCVVGLEIHSNGNTIRGLQIINFPDVGIILSGGAKHNMIGGDRRIGSGPLGQGNLISGNIRGIGIWDEGVSFNTITGNLIGTDVTGLNSLGNQGPGIQIARGAHHNTIGPDNIIAYNGDAGIEIGDPDSVGNTITQNSIHSNGAQGIFLRDGGNAELTAPSIVEFDLDGGIVTGATCRSCTVEIFSDSANEGEVYEGRSQADTSGAFAFDKRASLVGPHLTATATDAKGNTSEFSVSTLGTRRSSILQEGNDLPKTQLHTKPSRELEDNRIGTLMDLNDQFYEEIVPAGMEEQFIRTHEEIGVKRMRLLLDIGDFPLVDWSARQASTRLSPRQVATIARFSDAGIDVMATLIFWDVDARGQRPTPGYSRFRDEGEVIRFLEFARETVRRLRGHVAYYELLNEPNAEVLGPTGTQQDVRLPDYINLVERVVPIIREEDPEARIAVGAVANIQRIWQEPTIMSYLFGLLESRVMPLVDAITFHPMYNVTPQDDSIQQYYVGYPDPDPPVPPEPEEVQQYYDDYPDLLRRMRATATVHGFQGEFIADELTWWSPNEDIPVHYPAPPLIFPVTQAAKYYARAIVLHLGMDVTAQVRLIPDFGHLETRTIQNLCTIMAGNKPMSLPVAIQSEATNIKSYGFSLPNGDNLFALWTDGVAVDDDPGTPATLVFPRLSAQKVMGIDVLHGFEQELITDAEDGNLVIHNLLVKDYPIILRLTGVERTAP